jgi:hypothetical protein
MCKEQPHHGYEQTPLYSWSADGDPMILPEGAAFLVDTNQYIVMQTHYPKIQSEPDFSGMKLMAMEGEELESAKKAGMLFNMYYDMEKREMLPAKSTSQFSHINVNSF